MANIKSSEKDIRRSERRRLRNQAVKSSLRTAIKKLRAIALTGDDAAKEAQYRKTQSIIDKAAQKGVIKKNTASRYKSRLRALL